MHSQCTVVDDFACYPRSVSAALFVLPVASSAGNMLATAGKLLADYTRLLVYLANAKRSNLLCRINLLA